GQDHVALHQVLREDRVHPGPDRVVVAHPLPQHEHLVGHAAEDHVGVGDLGALGGRVLRVHDAGAGAGRGEDLRALLVGDAGSDQVRSVEDLHGGSYRETIMYVARPTAHSLPAASVTLASPKAIVRPRRRILPSAKIGPWPAAARKLTLRSRVDWLTPPAAES